MPRGKAKTPKTANGANLGFEEKLWLAADKLRGHMDAAEYKHVGLGLVFLKYISDAFQTGISNQGDYPTGCWRLLEAMA
jgi:type I restriction enzyme M protein